MASARSSLPPVLDAMHQHVTSKHWHQVSHRSVRTRARHLAPAYAHSSIHRIYFTACRWNPKQGSALRTNATSLNYVPSCHMPVSNPLLPTPGVAESQNALPMPTRSRPTHASTHPQSLWHSAQGLTTALVVQCTLHVDNAATAPGADRRCGKVLLSLPLLRRHHEGVAQRAAGCGALGGVDLH